MWLLEAADAGGRERQLPVLVEQRRQLEVPAVPGGTARLHSCSGNKRLHDVIERMKTDRRVPLLEAANKQSGSVPETCTDYLGAAVRSAKRKMQGSLCPGLTRQRPRSHVSLGHESGSV